MMAQLIDRKEAKAEARTLLSTAQVGPKGLTALYLGLVLLLNVTSTLLDGISSGSLPSTFINILILLMGTVLAAGFTLYFMTVRQGQRAEYITLFDGFSFAGKIIGLTLIQTIYIFFWSMLLIVPGIVAAYRYRFAMYNLCEAPDISIFEAMALSKRQTAGYKSQLLMLDLSYLGWGLLASIPAGILDWANTQTLFHTQMAHLPPLASSVLSLSPLTWTLVIGLWDLVISVFYRPVYQCTTLGYFAIAKETSGASVDAGRGQDDPPDDLGGW